MLDGAVYRPDEEIVPIAGLIDHVTAVLLVPDTAAVNCWLPAGPKVTADGLTTSVTACRRVKTALALLLGSATLVAVIVTVCVVEAVLGAIYVAVVPELTKLPSDGFTVQVTPKMDVPVTVAVSDCVWEGSRVTVAGVREAETGDTRTIEAVPTTAGLATLAAVTTTVCPVGMDAGAV
jgi:hypothetical protein